MSICLSRCSSLAAIVSFSCTKTLLRSTVSLISRSETFFARFPVKKITSQKQWRMLARKWHHLTLVATKKRGRHLNGPGPSTKNSRDVIQTSCFSWTSFSASRTSWMHLWVSILNICVSTREMSPASRLRRFGLRRDTIGTLQISNSFVVTPAYFAVKVASWLTKFASSHIKNCF